jgi:uncharacterized protein
MKRFYLFSSFVLLAVLAGGCQQSPSGLAVVSMQIGNRTFHLEVAATADSQETGLMKRDSMPDDHGMIFVFGDESPRTFWMKNTRFPLDIIFVNTAGVVVSIKQMDAYDLHETPSDKPARYAIELNKGAAESAGVKVGDQLTIPTEARSK